MPLVVRGKNNHDRWLMFKKSDNLKIKTNKQLSGYSQRYILKDNIEAWINNKFNFGNIKHYDFGYGCGVSICNRYKK